MSEYAGKYDDTVEDRVGEWMQTSMGGRFFPLDPRPEDFCISDLANGMAMDCRYAGQGRVERYYSVAEHSVHMAQYSVRDNIPPEVSMVVLLHDAAEGFFNDLPRAVKHAVGDAYTILEDWFQRVIWVKYGLLDVALAYRGYVKDLDQRMVPLEKAAIMRYPQPWAYDQFKPLEGITIQCWDPADAKVKWLRTYVELCKPLNWIVEEYEI